MCSVGGGQCDSVMVLGRGSPYKYNPYTDDYNKIQYATLQRRGTMYNH